MRKLLILFLVVMLCMTNVSAKEYAAPAAPDSAEELLPEESSSFGEDLWYIIKSAIANLYPDIAEAAGICMSLIAVILFTSLLQSFSGVAKTSVELACTITIGILLIQPANSLIRLGMETVAQLCEYGKLLIPVLTAAMASEGGVTTSAALYTGTVFFNTALSTIISKLVIPLVYVHIALCIANNAIGADVLKKLRDFIKWLMTWCLKITIYLFTGYIGITGVIGGTTDASAVKAAKLAISGFVPVVGSIISDASETILVSAGVIKNTVGVYGLLVIVALWIRPFLQIGVQYILLKITSAVCSVFGTKESVNLIYDFSGTMGILLAMTGTVCLLHLISTVCFMKGVT